MEKVWLLWLALASVILLPPLGGTPFISLGVGTLLVLIWVAINISPKRVFCSFMLGVLDIFFRDIQLVRLLFFVVFRVHLSVTDWYAGRFPQSGSRS